MAERIILVGNLGRSTAPQNEVAVDHAKDRTAQPPCEAPTGLDGGNVRRDDHEAAAPLSHWNAGAGVRTGVVDPLPDAKNLAALKALTTVIGDLMRAFRFLCSCIRLRSISRAVWVDAYDYAEVQK